MSKQIQGDDQNLELKTLSKMKFLFIYISDEQGAGCLPFLFFIFYFPLQSIGLSTSTFITEGSTHNTKV